MSRAIINLLKKGRYYGHKDRRNNSVGLDRKDGRREEEIHEANDNRTDQSSDVEAPAYGGSERILPMREREEV
jgi:hypothetical protein